MSRADVALPPIRPGVYNHLSVRAAEFASPTAYMYSTYEEECEAAPSDARKVVILAREMGLRTELGDIELEGLVPPGELRDSFLAAHGDLLDVEFWQGVQRRLAAGEVVDVFPYRRSALLSSASG